jgi:hypothetical protein
VNHGDAVARLGHAAQGRTTAVAVSLSAQAAKHGGGGYDGESSEWRPAHGVTILFTEALSPILVHESKRRRHKSRRRVTGGEIFLALAV